MVERYVSEMDTLRFGFKVAKINEFSDTPLKTIQSFKQKGIKLVISRVSTSDVGLINEMEEVGFRLKDVQVTYNFDLEKNSPPSVPDNSYKYRSFKQSDTSSIVSIAAESFQDYGHYSKNEKTEVANTSRIYEDWARRSCLNKDIADNIIVAEKSGNVAGFLSYKVLMERQSRYAAGVMGAVANDHREGGVFLGINIASLHWAKKEGMRRVENNVLVTNLPVNKTYISLGYRIIRSETTFHCWLE
jgi:ribosomal protein S18 acetylase RimI-like enzyme